MTSTKSNQSTWKRYLLWASSLAVILTFQLLKLPSGPVTIENITKASLIEEVADSYVIWDARENFVKESMACLLYTSDAADE